MKTTSDYWFTIEPYVYINIVDKCALLYNTLDGVCIESNQPEVISLLQEVLQEENCGVTLLNSERFQQPEIYKFVDELREKYMGDVIDICLSEGKPVQVFPYINYSNKRNKKCNFAFMENLLQSLFEVNIHLDQTSDIEKLKAYLRSVPANSAFNIIGDWRNVKNGKVLMEFLNQKPTLKSIVSFYTDIPILDAAFKNDFLYKISVNFPISKLKWEKSIDLMQNQDLPFGYVFDVTSLSDYQEAQSLIAEYQIEKYQLNPVYTGNNIDFFKENIFLSKEDVLSTQFSMRDLFCKRLINKNDFGKIHIMADGMIYANINHPMLGNMRTHNISEIIQKEIEMGQSWLRIRNSSPCDKCLYQDLCPSPSDYEIAIGYPNLCHLK